MPALGADGRGTWGALRDSAVSTVCCLRPASQPQRCCRGASSRTRRPSTRCCSAGQPLSDAPFDAGSHWLTVGPTSGRPLPWQPLFSAHERRLVWSADLQARLVKSFAAEDLSLSLEEVDMRLQQLLVLLPELASRVGTLKPALLAALLRTPAVVAQRLVGLRLALPTCDVKELVLRDPAVLLREVEDVVAEMAAVAGILGLSDRITQELVSLQPRFLDAEGMVEVVKELQRLLPGAEPGQVLRSDPSWLLRLERGPKKVGALPEDKCY